MNVTARDYDTARSLEDVHDLEAIALAALEPSTGTNAPTSPLTIKQLASPKWDEDGDCALVDTEGKIVGEAYRTVGHGDTRPAQENARLWAAAPELLESLKWSLQFAERFASEHNDGPTMAACIGQARAAIAKATGAAQ